MLRLIRIAKDHNFQIHKMSKMITPIIAIVEKILFHDRYSPTHSIISGQPSRFFLDTSSSNKMYIFGLYQTSCICVTYLMTYVMTTSRLKIYFTLFLLGAGSDFLCQSNVILIKNIFLSMMTSYHITSL